MYTLTVCRRTWLNTDVDSGDPWLNIIGGWGGWENGQRTQWTDKLNEREREDRDRMEWKKGELHRLAELLLGLIICRLRVALWADDLSETSKYHRSEILVRFHVTLDWLVCFTFVVFVGERVKLCNRNLRVNGVSLCIHVSCILTFQMRVTVGDLGLCCSVCVTSFER